ncbi:MAG TPA: aminodeoxychorismate lyase [Gammaproteobacteria bacterium]
MESLWLVNGERKNVDPSDRGLAYGDGVFETMACRAGRIRWLDYHLDRLTHGCARLAIPTPDRSALRAEIEAHCPALEDAVVKLIVTRGSGARGYAPPEPAKPTRILSIAPWSEPPAADYTRGIGLKTCALRLGENPQLAGLKHLCRLEQVLARMELVGTSAQEGLVRSSGGFVVGGISSNVFAVRGGRLLTPRLTRCGVHGVMRRVVLEQAARAGLEAIEADIDLPTLLDADELFVTNALFGIKPVSRVDACVFSVGPRTQALMRLLGYGPNA